MSGGSVNVLFLSWSDQNRCNALRAAALNRCGGGGVVGRCWAVRGHHDFDASPVGLREALEWSDVVHVADTYPFEFGVFGHTRDNGWFDVERRRAFVELGKRRVFEFKGGFLRMYSKFFWAWQSATLTPIVTTPDLGRYVPRFHYLPLPIDVWDGAYRPSSWGCDGYNPSGLVGGSLRVCQSPTRRDYKDTDALERVCGALDGVELVLLEGLPRAECLEKKRGCDAYFGKFKVGDFGLSEREALSMGLVVLCRLQPLVRAHNPACPIVSVGSEEELAEKLAWLRDNPVERAELGVRSRGWAESFLSFEAVGPRMAAFYEYVAVGDDWSWWDRHAEIWKGVAKREHGIEDFVDVKKVRW